MRLIDADALGVCEAKPGGIVKEAFAHGWNSVLTIINNAHTVDAVPVVRCAACRHAETDKIGCYCNLHDDRVAENGFCSYGERKEIVNDG